MSQHQYVDECRRRKVRACLWSIKEIWALSAGIGTHVPLYDFNLYSLHSVRKWVTCRVTVIHVTSSLHREPEQMTLRSVFVSKWCEKVASEHDRFPCFFSNYLFLSLSCSYTSSTPATPTKSQLASDKIATIVACSMRGRALEEISNSIAVSQRTLQRWVKRFQNGGNVSQP